MIDLRKISFPIYETLLYLLFLIFTFFSLINSLDKESAIEFILFYLLGFLIYIFSFNLSKKIKDKFPKLILVISLFLIIIFLANFLFRFDLFDSNDLFYTDYDHLQIGNFILLGLIASPLNLLSLVYLIFVLFSFSRTAYLSLIIYIFLQFNRFKNKIFLILLIGVITFFLISLSTNFIFKKNKKILGNRNLYFSYALKSIKKSPWIGVGPGNFYYVASQNQINYYENTTSTHNIILDIFTENGIFAGISFLLFLLLIILKSKKDKNFYLLISLTIIFLLDFSYRIPIFFITYFVLLGVSTQSKNTIINKNILVLLVLLSFLFYQWFFISKFSNSLTINPFQRNLYIKMINKKIQEKKIHEAEEYLNKYNYYFGKSFNDLISQAEYWKYLGNTKNSLALRKKIFYLRPLNQLNIERIYEFGGKEYFVSLIESYFKENKIDKKSDLGKLISSFCKDYNLDCSINFL